MKMSLGCCYMLLLLVFVAVVSGVVEDVKKIVGIEVRFKPDITAGTSLKDKTLTWKYVAGGEVIKVIEWDNDFQTLEKLNPKFRDHVDLNRNDGELTIRDLQLEHTGLYTIEINNKEQEKKIKLTVLEGVPKPTLIPEKTDTNEAVMYLTCEYNAVIRWNCSDGEKPQITQLEKPRQGEFITFTRDKMPNVCCTCTLINEVSEETSNSLCEKDLFPASSGGNYWWIVFVVIGIGICISPFILYIFYDPFRNHIRKKYEKNSCLKGFIGCLESCRNKIRCLGDDKDEKSKKGDDDDGKSKKGCLEDEKDAEM